jgi:hypothetical protein
VPNFKWESSYVEAPVANVLQQEQAHHYLRRSASSPARAAFGTALGQGLVHGRDQLLVLQHLVGMFHPRFTQIAYFLGNETFTEVECCRRASIIQSCCSPRPASRLLLLLPLLAQAVAIEFRQRTANLPKGSPGSLRPAGGFGMLWRNVQRAASAVFSISNVEVWPVPAFGVLIAGTAGIAATARGFRQAALDHGFRCAEKSLDQPLLLLTHSLILQIRLVCFGCQQENDMNYQKCFRAGNCTILRSSVAAAAGSKRLNRSFLRRKVAKRRRKNNFTDSVELYSSIEEVLCQG